MPSDIDSYKINSSSDLNVSDFFEKTEYKQWSFSNFYNYKLDQNPKIKLRNAKHLFQIDIDRLMKYNDLPRVIKSALGHLKEEALNYTVGQDTLPNTLINNGVYFSNCDISNATINNNVSPEVSKKRKLSAIDQDGCWTINSNEDFWNTWKESCDNCTCHSYCLEQYHIIECGYTIKCKSSYDIGLYEQLGDNTTRTFKSPFMSHSSIVLNIIQKLQTGNQRDILRALMADDLWDLIEESDTAAKFIYSYFDFINRHVISNINIEDKESSYNYEVVWPIINLAVKQILSKAPTLLFRTGEILLDASDTDFKADALVEIEGMEFLLLETSGPYNINDNIRFSQDHIKGSFGALTFLRKILKTWHFATEETMQKLKVIFIHARGTKIHLWTLEIPTKDIQVLDHVYSTEIPLKASDTQKAFDLGNFTYKLQQCIDHSLDIMKKMKTEHDEYLIMKQLKPDVDSRTNLSTFVEREIQKPVKGSKYGVLLPKQLEDCEIHKKLVKS